MYFVNFAVEVQYPKEDDDMERIVLQEKDNRFVQLRKAIHCLPKFVVTRNMYVTARRIDIEELVFAIFFNCKANLIVVSALAVNSDKGRC